MRTGGPKAYHSPHHSLALLRICSGDAATLNTVSVHDHAPCRWPVGCPTSSFARTALTFQCHLRLQAKVCIGLGACFFALTRLKISFVMPMKLHTPIAPSKYTPESNGSTNKTCCVSLPTFKMKYNNLRLAQAPRERRISV